MSKMIYVLNGPKLNLLGRRQPEIWIHEAREAACGIVINPAAFTHTSVAILDALNTFEDR